MTINYDDYFIMKIILVRPYFRHNPYEPPLGIAILSAYIRNAGYDVNILDLEALGVRTEGDIRKILKKESPDIVGISFFTYDRFQAAETAKIAKECGAVVIGGGLHVSFDPVNTLDKIRAFDYGIIGEGEETFKELLDCIKSGTDVKNVKGLVYRENGRIIKNDTRDLIKDLDSLPMPDYHLLPMALYPYHQIMGSRGCPYNCIFCASPEFWRRKVRYRSPEKIVDEIEYLVKNYGNKEFDFKDDILFLNKEWTARVCNEILDRGLSISWNCLGRVDVIDVELFRLMKKAGCKTLRFGVESGSERILEKIGKNINKENVRNAVRAARSIPFETGTMFMLGHPSETKEEMDQTYDFALELGAEHYSFKPVDIYPGTKLYDIAVTDGIIPEDFDWFEQGKYKRGFHTYEDIPTFESGPFTRTFLENTAKKYYVRSFFDRIFAYPGTKDVKVSRFMTGMGFVPAKPADFKILGEEILGQLRKKRLLRNKLTGIAVGASLFSKKILRKLNNKNRRNEMKQVFIKKGKVLVEDMPVPGINPGEMLVQVCYSCISSGTELSGIKKSGYSLMKRAMEDPENVRKTIDLLRHRGLVNTINEVRKQTSGQIPVGYSASGIVIETGSGIQDISVGDRVACCGSGIANHSEFISVPRNLAVKVPEDIGLDLASTASLGSIAMQAVRRADPKLGEHVTVIGLGVLGQIIVQILKAAGCRVTGMDIVQDRINKALSLGMEEGINPGVKDPAGYIEYITRGCYMDSVIITASSKDSDIIDQAMEIVRKKGKVVIVGDIGLTIDRKKFYKKELDLLMSTSYGPGRYDEKYELHGADYPYEYVRWTENRNMQAYIGLMKDGRINIKGLIDKIFPVEKAMDAFDCINTKEAPIITLLEYNKDAERDTKIAISAVKAVNKDVINTGIIGAGNFFGDVLAPVLKRLGKQYSIHAVMSKRGVNAKSMAVRYGAEYAATDADRILGDSNIDMAVISTRHDIHSSLAVKAARAGKAVFLEKPMALDREELKDVTDVIRETGVPFMVGYNRRFSPFMKKIKDIVKYHKGPLMINYRMNAGFIPADSWVHTAEGGGRNIGEACHIYDLFTYLTGEEAGSVSAFRVNAGNSKYFSNDNFVAIIKYKDGSVCTLTYTAMGTNKYPKEEMELYADGSVLKMIDYKKLETFGSCRKEKIRSSPNKGHFEEFKAFKEAMDAGDGYPIPLWELVQASEISFKVEEALTR